MDRDQREGEQMFELKHVISLTRHLCTIIRLVMISTSKSERGTLLTSPQPGQDQHPLFDVGVALGLACYCLKLTRVLLSHILCIL